MDPVELMRALGKMRSVFHSEGDFQHAFAWELHRAAPDLDIRLELPVRTATGVDHLDLFTSSTAQQVAVELKYKTRALNTVLGEEEFNLTSHSAQDLGRYDFFKDISRVEAFVQAGTNRTGYVIFLTNDSAYWKAPSDNEHAYVGFAMNDGREVSGSLHWGKGASDGTRRKREQEIAIRGCYRLKWLPFSSIPVRSYREFRFLCVAVEGAPRTTKGT